MRKLLYIAVLVALCCHAAHGANFQPSPTSTTWSAIKSTIDANFQKAANVQEENTFQKAQEFRVGITAPEYFSSAADGEIVARIYNTVAITAPPAVGAIAYLNDRYWLANGTNWTSLWLLDNSKIGVAGGVQGYSARLDTVVNMSGINKYTGTNALGEFGVHDLPSGGGPAYTLPPATAQDLGGIKAGQRVTIAPDGTLSADDQSYTPTAATDNALGVVRPGSGLSVDASGVLSVTLSEAASGYVTPPPTYSDSPCTAGQYAAGGGYYYICTTTNTWDRVALTSWSNPTPQAQPPTLTARAIQTDGTTLRVTASRAVKAGTGGTGGWSMTCTNAGAVGVTYSTGLPGAQFDLSLSNTILNNDTCTLNYTNPGLGIIANDDDQALASFSEVSVYNGSGQPGGGGGDPDYVPARAYFYFGSGTLADYAEICIFTDTGTPISCTSPFSLEAAHDENNAVIYGEFTGLPELPAGDYILGIKGDYYMKYVANDSADSWATHSNEQLYNDPQGNLTLPGTDQAMEVPAIWVTNANGDTILGNDDIASYTDDSTSIKGGNGENIAFWTFTRVTLP